MVALESLVPDADASDAKARVPKTNAMLGCMAALDKSS